LAAKVTSSDYPTKLIGCGLLLGQWRGSFHFC